MNYLVFRLYGPIASWGEIAVGENRHTATYPSKSAITGLLGAALGIERNNELHQQALVNDYALAVKMLASGALLKDFHTAQAPDSVGKFRYRTRRDELVLGKDRLGTVLSSREYRTDSVALVAIKAVDKPTWSLEALQQALQRPKFHLYLGRKSCPLAAPLQAELIEADDFLAAFTGYQPKALLPKKPEWVKQESYLRPDTQYCYYWQGGVEDFAASSTVPAHEVQTLIRRDQPLSRTRWQFQIRSENMWVQSCPQGGDV